MPDGRVGNHTCHLEAVSIGSKKLCDAVFQARLVLGTHISVAATCMARLQLDAAHLKGPCIVLALLASCQASQRLRPRLLHSQVLVVCHCAGDDLRLEALQHVQP